VPRRATEQARDFVAMTVRRPRRYTGTEKDDPRRTVLCIERKDPEDGRPPSDMQCEELVLCWHWHSPHDTFARSSRSRGQRKGPRAVCEQRHPFMGLLTCARCGCTKVKKGRYVYYRCTAFKAGGGNTYVRQEILRAAPRRHDHADSNLT
jgi:hypothetical protein